MGTSRGAWSWIMAPVVAVALAGCGDAPSSSSRGGLRSEVAAQTEISRSRTQQAFSGTAQTCDGETAVMTTVVDHRSQLTTLRSGEWRLTQHSRFSVEGVTSSDLRYRGHGTANTTQNFAAVDRGAFTFTSVVRMRNIVQGPAANDVSVVHAKWTINANGEVTVDRLDIAFDCQG